MKVRKEGVVDNFVDFFASVENISRKSDNTINDSAPSGSKGHQTLETTLFCGILSSRRGGGGRSLRARRRLPTAPTKNERSDTNSL